MNAVKNRFLVYHLPVVLYAGLILTLSSIGNLSTPQVEWFALDKVAHFVEYALFAFLTFRSFTHLGERIGLNTAALLALLFLVCFALLDEYCQRFVPGRFSDFFDVLSDTFGAGLVVVYLWYRQRSRSTQGHQ